MFFRTIRAFYNQFNLIKQPNIIVNHSLRGRTPTIILMLCKHTIEESKFVATYEDVKNLKKDTVLIDVREPNELRDTGMLPDSINIPLGDLENAFRNMSSNEFYKRFGRDKPSLDQEMIFSCKAGVRAEKAKNFVAALGYNNARFYKGSWDEWAEKSSSK